MVQLHSASVTICQKRIFFFSRQKGLSSADGRRAEEISASLKPNLPLTSQGQDLTWSAQRALKCCWNGNYTKWTLCFFWGGWKRRREIGEEEERSALCSLVWCSGIDLQRVFGKGSDVQAAQIRKQSVSPHVTIHKCCQCTSVILKEVLPSPLRRPNASGPPL